VTAMPRPLWVYNLISNTTKRCQGLFDPKLQATTRPAIISTQRTTIFKYRSISKQTSDDIIDKGQSILKQIFPENSLDWT
jgi:hypothetical protein